MTVTEACEEALWLKGLFVELSDQLQISTLFCDNQSAIFSLKIKCFMRERNISM